MTIIKRLCSYLSFSKDSDQQKTNIELPYFGKINYTKLDEYYSTEIKYDSIMLRLYMLFKNKSISLKEIENIKYFLNVFLHLILRIEINNDLNNDGEAKDHANFYLEELEEEELSEIIDFTNLIVSQEQQIINKLKLIDVGLHSDNNVYTGIFEYSIAIDGEMCNQVLVVYVDINGSLDKILWES